MRQLLVIAIFFLCLTACRDKVICPAFQSAYILDDSVRDTFYSYLWKLDEAERNNYLASRNSQTQPVSASADTTGMLVTTDTIGLASPLDSGAIVASANQEVDYFAYVQPYTVEPREVNKTKFGIIKKENYWLKNYRLRTAPKENVLKPLPPETEPPVEDVGEFIASDFTDSVSIDSTGVAMVNDSTMLASSANEEDTTFEIPKLAQVEPPKPTTELKYLYRYDPNDKMLNVEQAYYNKHFGQYLYTRVPINQPADTTAQSVDSLANEGGGFFKNLFGNLFSGGGKKLEEPPVDEPPLEEPPADEPVNDDAVIEEDPNDGF